MRAVLPALITIAAHARNFWYLVRRPLTVGVRVVVIRDGRVLLLKHSYCSGWHFPGGGVERGETLADAARRETREEVGVAITPPSQPFGVYTRFAWGASDHIAVFVIKDDMPASVEGPVADGIEIAECGFFPISALPAETTPGTRRRLTEIESGAPSTSRW